MTKGKRAPDGAGSLYRRKDGIWAGAIRVGWQDGQRKRVTVYGKTPDEVFEQLDEVRRRTRAGMPAFDGGEPLAEYLESWLTDTLPGTVKPATEASYGNIVRRHLIPTLGKVSLRKLTPGHVRRLLREKSQESNGRDGMLSPRMVQYIHAVLRRALEQARRDELVVRNVAALVQPPRVPRQEYRWLTEEEAKRLVAAVRNDRLYAVYALALGLGLRRGEVLGLRWVDVDLDAAIITVRRSLQRLGGKLVLVEPKTKRSYRQVPLPRLCVDALREHRERQDKERADSPVWLDEWGLVFTTKHGTPIEPRNLLRHFYGLCERLGLPRLRFHDLRHSCASLLLVRGVQPATIMETLGHAVIHTTMQYAHVMPRSMREAAATMDDLLATTDEGNGRSDGRSGEKDGGDDAA
jgi:integrase